jgi:hypothetical protein
MSVQASGSATGPLSIVDQLRTGYLATLPDDAFGSSPYGLTRITKCKSLDEAVNKIIETQEAIVEGNRFKYIKCHIGVHQEIKYTFNQPETQPDNCDILRILELKNINAKDAARIRERLNAGGVFPWNTCPRT